MSWSERCLGRKEGVDDLQFLKVTRLVGWPKGRRNNAEKGGKNRAETTLSLLAPKLIEYALLIYYKSHVFLLLTFSYSTHFPCSTLYKEICNENKQQAHRSTV